MFRDDYQRGEVCFILCAWIPGSTWAMDGRGYRPVTHNNLSSLSTGELAMLRFAKRLWLGDGDDAATGLPVWTGFDARRMRDIAELLTALVGGPEAIDAWILQRSDPFIDRLNSREAWEVNVRRRART